MPSVQERLTSVQLEFSSIMRRIRTPGLLFVSCFVPAAAVLGQALPRVLVVTNLGEIEIEIDTVNAPVTASNFLMHVDASRYDGGAFYRTVTMKNQPNSSVKIEVIQGGLAPGQPRPQLEAIGLERTNTTGLRHLDGTISMARADPNTATTEIFICIGDQPELDFGGKRNSDGQGFAAFGRVVSGMEVVRAIHAQPARGQSLAPPVPVVSITRQ